MAAQIVVTVVVNKSQLDALKVELESIQNRFKNIDINVNVKGNMKSAAQNINKLNQELNDLNGKAGKTYAVKVSTTGATSGLKNLNTTAKTTTSTLNNLLKTASKYATWYALGTAITTMVNAFSDAINTMKEVDTQLTNIQKVSADADIEGISQRIYENASKYGVAAQDFGASIYEFQKAGYGDASEQMAELATKTMLVGDTTASVADKFLIVADTAWNMGHSIEDLNMLIDEADYINNNYATSLDKLAEGFPRVASVASMAGMSAEETMAALGTITASTQETASKAGTALRALILNILGDTTTEVEEGVTVTEDQVKSLRGVLNIYAKDVVAAADATGELIDPMEAIGALSKAYKDGLLTTADLYKIESALGGKLRTNQLDALLKNFDNTYMSMMEGMKTAAGTADKEIDTMMNSWEKKVQVLQNTWTQFVANTVNTDWVKGFIDGLTRIISDLDNLGNVLAIIGGVIVSLKLPGIVSTLGKVGGVVKTAAQQFIALATGAKTAALSLSTVQVAMLGLVAAYTAYTIANGEYLRSIDEAAEQATKTANESVSEAEKINGLYSVYESAKAAYESGVGSKEAYITATANLAEALGLESAAFAAAKGELEGYTGEIENATQAVINKAIVDTKLAINALKKQMVAASGGESLATDFVRNWIGWDEEHGLMTEWDKNAMRTLTSEEKYEMMLGRVAAAQEEINNIRSKGNKATDEEIKRVAELQKQYGDILPIYQEIQEREEQLKELSGETADAVAGPFDELEKKFTNISGSEAAKESLQSAIDSWGEGFETLASRIDEATAAFERYNKQVENQKGSKLAAEGNIYKAFLEDWNKGLKGSTNVLAAEDFFFTPQQIAEFAKQGIDAGEALASEVFQGWFSYLDENGEQVFSGGEDYGALFSNYLSESLADAEGNVSDATGKIVAHFETIGDTTGLVVDDLDGLAEMFGVSADAITPMLEALGVYSAQVWETADGMKAMLSETEGAITGMADGIMQVDTSAFFEGLVQSGQYAQQELNSIADSLVEMQSQGEIQLDIQGNAEDVKAQLYDTIADLETVNETEATATVEGETADAQSQVQSVQEQLDNLVGGSPYTGVLDASDNATPTINSVQSAMTALDGTTATVTINAVQNGSTSVSTSASAAGTTNAAGGLTLVNEEGPEIIAEGNSARIANGGLPTLTYIQKGATVFNADDTRRIFDSSGIQMFSGASAMASGNFSGIPSNWAGSKGGTSLWGGGSSGGGGGSSSGGGGSSGGSGGGGGSSSSSDSDSSSETDEQLEALKDIVALRKSELDILDATNASTVEQANKEWEIMDALKAEWTYLQESGGEQKDINDLIAEFWETRQKIVELYKDEYETQASLKESELELLEKTDASVKSQIDKQNEIKAIYKKEMEYLMLFTDDQEEINKLKAKQLDIEKEIAELRKGMYDDLREGIDNEIDAIEKERDAQTKLIDDRIKALQDEHDLKEETEELEEKILAVQEAEANLQKAQNERTVRYFNAATGQWEWGANAKDVQSATEALEDAQKNLEDAYYQQQIDDLEKQKELIEEEADARIKEWEEIKEVIAEPLLTVAEAIAELSRSADRSMKGTVDALNALLAKFGYRINTTYDSGGVLSGLGGIKATARDEMILPPDITKRMLSPTAGSMFMQRMSELGYLYGNKSLAGMSPSIGSQYNGDTYNFGNITLTKEQAKQTTVYQLAKLSRGLRAYSAAN